MIAQIPTAPEVGSRWPWRGPITGRTLRRTWSRQKIYNYLKTDLLAGDVAVTDLLFRQIAEIEFLNLEVRRQIYFLESDPDGFELKVWKSLVREQRGLESDVRQALRAGGIFAAAQSLKDLDDPPGEKNQPQIHQFQMPTE